MPRQPGRLEILLAFEVPTRGTPMALLPTCNRLCGNEALAVVAPRVLKFGKAVLDYENAASAAPSFSNVAPDTSLCRTASVL